MLGVHHSLCHRDGNRDQVCAGPLPSPSLQLLPFGKHLAALSDPTNPSNTRIPPRLLRRYQTNVVQLSPQSLVDCFYGPASNPFYGCDGGDLPVYAIRWTSGVNAWKLPTNAAYPYTASTGNCNSALLSKAGMTVFGWVCRTSFRVSCGGGGGCVCVARNAGIPVAAAASRLLCRGSPRPPQYLPACPSRPGRPAGPPAHPPTCQSIRAGTTST